MESLASRKRKTNKAGNRKKIRNYLKEVLGQDRCSHCRKTEGNVRCLTIDHIIPLCKGGLDDYANYQLLCNLCNTFKGGRLTTRPIKAIKAQEVRDLFIQLMSGPYGREYVREVFRSAFGEVREYSVITLPDVISLYTYANAYGLPGLVFKSKVAGLKFNKVPFKDNQFILQYDPSFILSEEANKNYVDRMANKYAREYRLRVDYER